MAIEPEPYSDKHNSAHHSYTNIAGHDDDLDTNGLIRMSPEQPYHRFYRFQHLYAWALYAFLVPKWIIYDDYAVLKAGKIAETPIKPPQGVELGVFIGGKIFAYTLAFIIPMFFHPVWLVLAFYLLVNAVTGVTLATVFQLAHVLEETSFPQPRGEAVGNTFARHQLQTTADFAPRNKLLTWYVGGLNFQVEHHLFPRIAHTHYPALAQIVRKRAEEAGIPHLSHPTLRSAIAAHYRHLRTLGQPALVAV